MTIQQFRPAFHMCTETACHGIRRGKEKREDKILKRGRKSLKRILKNQIKKRDLIPFPHEL